MLDYAFRIFNAYKGDEYMSRQEKILLAILAVLLAKYENNTNTGSTNGLYPTEGPYSYSSVTR